MTEAPQPIPKFLFQVSKEENVLEAFIKHFSLEISHYFQPLVKKIQKMSTNTNKKEIQIYHDLFIHTLETFPPLDATVNTSISTFALLTKDNTTSGMNFLEEFYPPVLGHQFNPEKYRNSIFLYFPPISNINDDLGVLVGFVSDALFSLLTRAVFENAESIDEVYLTTVLRRIINRPNFPEVDSLSFRAINIVAKLYQPLLKIICKQNFLNAAKIFNGLFPSEKSAINIIIGFFTLSTGIFINNQDSIQFEKIYNLAIKLKKESNIMHAFFNFSCELLPQYNTMDAKIYDSLMKLVVANLSDPIAWASALRLMGVLHYIKEPNRQSKNFPNLFEKKVIGRFAKPHKVHAALDYVIAYIKPNDMVPLNKSPTVHEFISDIFRYMFKGDLSKNTQKAAHVLELMAALDLPRFTNEWIPQVLNPQSRYVGIALMTLQRVLNPLSGFYNLANSFKKGFKVYIDVLLERVKSLILQWFTDRPRQPLTHSFDFVAADEIISSIAVSPVIQRLNTINIPSNVLYFLLNYRKFMSIRKLPRVQLEDLLASEASTLDSIKQWMTTFETPIDYFGDFMMQLNLQMIHIMQPSDPEPPEIGLILLIPIILYYSQEKIGFIDPLIELILSPSPEISSKASVIYEVLFDALPNSAEFFITELGMAITNNRGKNCQQIHQLILTFYHVLKYHISLLKGSEQTALGLCDNVAIIALCSPYPETRQIGLDIIDVSAVLINFIDETSRKPTPCLYTFFRDRSQIIEQHIILSVISSFSSMNPDRCPIHRLPSIPIRSAALSPYLILWKFCLMSIESDMLKTNMTRTLLNARQSIMKSFDFVSKQEEISAFLNFSSTGERHHFANMIGFLFGTAQPIITTNDMFERTKWNEQTTQIITMLQDLTNAAVVMADHALPTVSFVFVNAHIAILQNVFDLFFKALRDESLKLTRKDSILVLFSIVLRNFAMSTEFNGYIGKLMSSGMINQIFNLYDPQFELLMNIEGSMHYSQLLQCLGHLTNFIVFRGQYFKYLHQSTLRTPHGPIPRCAISIVDNAKLISPVCDKNKLFATLMRWSMFGLGQEDAPDVQEALKSSKCKKEDLVIFGHVSRIALSYLTSLVPIFSDGSVFTLPFLSKISHIASARPSFIKHLLTQHYSIFLDSYFDAAMSSPLDTASRFMTAISLQFIAPTVKDSMIYTHDTFVKNMSTTAPQELTEEEKDFIELTYAKSGKILILGLLYMLHPEIKIRQHAMRMLGQVAAVLCVVHHNCDLEKAKQLMSAISKLIEALPTHITDTRVSSAVDFSTLCSQLFEYCTEQLLRFAFTILPKIAVSRVDCTRYQLLQIIGPWMRNIKFDIRHRTVLKNPSTHFIEFNPVSFMQEMVKCLIQITDITTPLKDYNLQIWKNLVEQSNAAFVVIALLDSGINNPEQRQFLKLIISYLYRLNSRAVIETVVPMLDFGNWYYQHVQLGTFEEIEDMSEFLKNIENPKFHVDINSAVAKYADICEFTLSLLTDLIREDIMPLVQSFPTIVSFCITHIKMESAFNLLHTMVHTLKAAYNSGVPECLLNACEIFSQISSVDFNSIQFVLETTTSPLRSLQEKKVSLLDILRQFIAIFGYMPSDENLDLSEKLLVWGTSCGNLETASVATDLYSAQFDTSNTKILNLIIESASIVSRCIVSEECSEETVKHSTDYVSAAIRAVIAIAKILIPQKMVRAHPILFWMAVAILGADGPLMENTVNDTMQLLIVLIDSNMHSIFDKGFMLECGVELKDFKPLFANAIESCNDNQVLFQFAMKVLKMPKELLSSDGNYFVYLMPLLPLLWEAVEATDKLAAICPARDLFEAFTVMNSLISSPHLSALVTQVECGKVTNIHAFTHDLVQVVMQSYGAAVMPALASFLCVLIKHSPTISMDCIFDMATAVLAVSPTSDVFRNLVPLTRQATLDQTLGGFAFQMPYLRTALSSGNAEQLSDLLVAPPEEKRKHRPEWASALQFVQNKAASVLHLNYKRSETYRVKFDTVDAFPPMFPFEGDFMMGKVADEVANFCRRIEVDPYSHFSFALYTAMDPAEGTPDEGEIPTLKLDIEFLMRANATIEEALAVEDDDEEETEHESATISASRSMTFVDFQPACEFLPTFDVVNKVMPVVDESMQMRAVTIPQVRMK